MDTITKNKQFCTFSVADLKFGIEATCVQEVFLYREMTTVPLAPPTISGLMNLRGQIVTVIDLRRRLELPDRSTEDQPMNVVLHGEDGAVSLLVDEIGDIVEPEDSAFEEPPESLSQQSRAMIRGAYKMPGHLLLVLDIDRVIDLAGENTGPSTA